MTENESFKELLARYISGELTETQRVQLRSMLDQPHYERELDEVLKTSFMENTYGKEGSIAKVNFMEGMRKRMETEMEAAQPGKTVHIRPLLRWAVAAAILVAVAVSGYYFIGKQNTQPVAATGNNRFKNDVSPGKDKAILTLPDGKTIVLDEQGNGQLADAEGINVVKQNGALAYTDNHNVKPIYNKVTTPAAGQYKLTLADGTKVWLDAKSSINFPVAFPGATREVEVTGQAYFEVAKNASKPFKVKVNDAVVEVLGTHFNINAYENEGDVRTTLLEGAVNVQKGDRSVRLHPGQQAVISAAGNMNVRMQPNIDEAVAWKDGMFSFDGADLQAIMRQVARWYDVTVEYETPVHGTFVAKIPRDVQLSDLLSLLEMTKQVQFKIEGRKVIVSKV